MEGKTRVVFRVWQEDGEDAGVFALFPDIPGDLQGNCTSYAHIGQHSAADYAYCIEQSRAAEPDKYAPLAWELRQQGYDLQIVGRR